MEKLPRPGIRQLPSRITPEFSGFGGLGVYPISLKSKAKLCP